MNRVSNGGRLHGPRNLLLTQYYRPPFPERRHWRGDLAQIAATGLDGIVTWAHWAWVESTPGTYAFDDIDDLFDEAERAGLGVVLSAGAEFSPLWIHREVPSCELVDHLGRPVPSTTSPSINQGLCPGGCTDHPEVRERAGRYLEALAHHFAGRSNLLHWDCWCELNWSWESEGHLLCFCEHTIAAFRAWLRDRYGDLEALGRAWRRRYASWEDVRPSLRPNRNWTETIAFEEFLAWRAAENVSFRVERLRAGDPRRPVIAHSMLLSPLMTQSWEPPLSRGSDWEVATRLDGFGASHFPHWFATSPTELGARLECARSAAAGRPYWVSELQGGSARHGLGALPEVTAAEQQRWIWSGYARGAEAVAFWCWRDDVIGREAGGFGVVCDDGHAADRLAALERTTAVLRRHEDLLGTYRPDPARVAVVFDGLNHQLDWADRGDAADSSLGSLRGMLLALERLQIPYDVVDAEHLGALDGYAVILQPWPMIVRPALAAALAQWVAAGGTLLTETELDAYDTHAMYRPPLERPFARALGIQGGGRRAIGGGEPIGFALDGAAGELRAAGWLDPLGGDGEAVATAGPGTVVLRRRVEAGTVIAVGTHAALGYARAPYRDFERFIEAVVTARGALPELRCSVADGERIQWRTGRSGEQQLLFVTNAGASTLAAFSAPIALVGGAKAVDELIGGGRVPITVDGDRAVLRLALERDDACVLVLGPATRG